MEDKDYSKREIDMQFKNLSDKVDENHAETVQQLNLLDRKLNDKNTEQLNLLQKIEQQTMKTNGRVNKVESFLYALKWVGVLAVTIVIPLIVYLYTTNLTSVNSRLDRQGQLILQK